MHTYHRNLVLFLAATLVCGGCAQRELIKKDAPSLPSALSTPTSVDKPRPVNQPVTPDSAVQEPLSAAPPKPATGNENRLQASLETIYFGFDSYELESAARETLVRDAQILKAQSGVRVTLEGHTDERGSDDYNLALGEKRAQAAMNYLVTLGVPAASLSTISYGREKPAAPGHDETAWGKNRRVEFVAGAH